jgi:hypothetical protein
VSEERVTAPETNPGGERGPLSTDPTPGANPPVDKQPLPASWADVLDPEVKGHVQNAGWDKLDPAAAAAMASRAHREAQKFLGVPPDQLARIPRPDAPELEVKAFWQRLGAPADPTAYKLAEVKSKAGSEIDEKFADHLAQTGVALNVPAAVLPKLAAQILDFFDTDALEAKTVADRALAAEKETLAANWGANAENNFLVAQRGAAALGLKEDFISSLEGVAGYATVMEGLRKIGVASGEARSMIGMNPAGPGGFMSVEQAQARIEEMKTDKEWFARWYKGDAAARREFEDVHRMALGRR